MPYEGNRPPQKKKIINRKILSTYPNKIYRVGIQQTNIFKGWPHSKNGFAPNCLLLQMMNMSVRSGGKDGVWVTPYMSYSTDMQPFYLEKYEWLLDFKTKVYGEVGAGRTSVSKLAAR